MTPEGTTERYLGLAQSSQTHFVFRNLFSQDRNRLPVVYFFPFSAILAHESRSVAVRLNTCVLSEESRGSRQK